MLNILLSTKRGSRLCWRATYQQYGWYKYGNGQSLRLPYFLLPDCSMAKKTHFWFLKYKYHLMKLVLCSFVNPRCIKTWLLRCPKNASKPLVDFGILGLNRYVNKLGIAFLIWTNALRTILCLYQYLFVVMLYDFSLINELYFKCQSSTCFIQSWDCSCVIMVCNWCTIASSSTPAICLGWVVSQALHSRCIWTVQRCK